MTPSLVTAGRIKVLVIQIPPLRDRPDDVLPLVDHFMSSEAAKFNKADVELSDKLKKLLRQHDWPENAGGVRNFVIRMLAETEGNFIDVQDLPAELRAILEGRRWDATIPEEPDELFEKLKTEVDSLDGEALTWRHISGQHLESLLKGGVLGAQRTVFAEFLSKIITERKSPKKVGDIHVQKLMLALLISEEKTVRQRDLYRLLWFDGWRKKGDKEQRTAAQVSNVGEKFREILDFIRIQFESEGTTNNGATSVQVNCDHAMTADQRYTVTLTSLEGDETFHTEATIAVSRIGPGRAAPLRVSARYARGS